MQGVAMSVTEDNRTAAIVAHSQMAEDVRSSGDDKDLIAYLDSHIGWLHELDLMTVETADELNAVNDPVFRAMMASRG